VCVSVRARAHTYFCVCVSVCAGCPQSTVRYIFSVKKLSVDSIDIAKTLTWQHTVLSHLVIVRCRCSVAICQIFTALYISDWNFISVWPKPHIPSFSWSMCDLLSGQPPLQNPNPGVPVAEGGNVFRRLTGAMVHPSQATSIQMFSKIMFVFQHCYCDINNPQVILLGKLQNI